MRNLVVISIAYPFGKGEDWMYKELKEGSRYYDQIYLFPLSKPSPGARWIPENCQVCEGLISHEKSSTAKIAVKNFGLVLSVLLTELTRSGKALYIVKNFRSWLVALTKAIGLSQKFQSDIQKLAPEHCTFYSVWMNEGSTMLSVLRKRGIISNFYMRLHGFDLFDERRDGGYMPFRVFTFKWAKKVFVLSQAGVEYLTKKQIPYASKLVKNYSGLYDNGEGQFVNNEQFTIVSCSNLLPFKRVGMIVEVLRELNFPVKWFHFGDGELFNEVRKAASSLPSNITPQFLGRRENQFIIDYYKSNHVNLFLHLSLTEGLGMSAVEAMSFGIPGMAIDTGGVKEVVNESTGVLLPFNANASHISSAIHEFKNSKKNTLEFRAGVRAYFLDKFDARRNYEFFFHQMKNE